MVVLKDLKLDKRILQLDLSEVEKSSLESIMKKSGTVNKGKHRILMRIQPPQLGYLTKLPPGYKLFKPIEVSVTRTEWGGFRAIHILPTLDGEVGYISGEGYSKLEAAEQLFSIMAQDQKSLNAPDLDRYGGFAHIPNTKLHKDYLNTLFARST